MLSNADDRSSNTRRHKKIPKQEYVITSPVPEVAINQGRRSSWDSQTDKQNSMIIANKNSVMRKGQRKHGGDHVLDVNQNEGSTGDEVTWNDDYDDNKIKKKDKKRKMPADSVKEKRKQNKG